MQIGARSPTRCGTTFAKIFADCGIKSVCPIGFLRRWERREGRLTIKGHPPLMEAPNIHLETVVTFFGHRPTRGRFKQLNVHSPQ